MLLFIVVNTGYGGGCVLDIRPVAGAAINDLMLVEGVDINPIAVESLFVLRAFCGITGARGRTEYGERYANNGEIEGDLSGPDSEIRRCRSDSSIRAVFCIVQKER